LIIKLNVAVVVVVVELIFLEKEYDDDVQLKRKIE
jgi:hypothetical protein